MHKNFSFRGINRSTDVALLQDGECLDIVNMRMSNGSLLPMPQPAIVAELKRGYSALFLHEIAQCYIGITDDEERTLHFYKKDFTPIKSGDEMLTINNLRGVNGVECIGNVVCCLTQSGIFYLIYEKGAYRGLGERPEIPDVNVTVSSKIETLVTENTYYTAVTTNELENTWGYNEKGYIEEGVAALNRAGYYIDRALFRVALRLYDGSYINISNIIYVSDETTDEGVGRDDENMVSEAMSATSPSQYKVRVRGFKPDFSFDASALANWRNIVVGIDIFSTMSIPGKKCRLEGRTQKTEKYTATALEDLWAEVASASLYYKVAEYDIDGNLTFRLDDVSPVNIALQQGLETETVPSSLSNYDVKSSFIYNGRLHIAAFKEYFFKGYNTKAYTPVSGDKIAVDEMLVQVKLRTTQGDFVTQRFFQQQLLGFDGYKYHLPPMLSYPDIRACEMGIYVKIGETIYGKLFPLKAHKYLNVAYYLHKWYLPYATSVVADFANGGSPSSSILSEDILKLFDYKPGVYEVVYSASRNDWVYDGVVFPPEEFGSMRIFGIHRGAVDGDKLIFTIYEDKLGDLSFKDINNIAIDKTWSIMESMPKGEVNSFEERNNVLKVSVVENPFVFPATHTYSPSQSAIVGMSSNTTALSQGQFGQFPLYVFCTDGIWAMSADTSGSVAYLTSHQVSRDVCINAKSICGVGSGVLFAGKQGMMFIAGNSVQNISLPLLGNRCSLMGVPYDIFAKISSLVSLDCSAGSDDFQNFISSAFVTYQPSQNEVLVCNAAYDYSFVYSLASGIWTRYKGAFMSSVKGAATPHFIVPLSGKTIVYSIADNVSGANRVLLFTRPQIWGTKLPKRVMQLLLHAYVEPPEKQTAGVPLLGCYLLCSNDGVHFKLIAGSEKSAPAQDVVFPYFPTQSYKYFLFAIVGEMGKASAVTGLEVDVNLPWVNRLR